MMDEWSLGQAQQVGVADMPPTQVMMDGEVASCGECCPSCRQRPHSGLMASALRWTAVQIGLGFGALPKMDQVDHGGRSARLHVFALVVPDVGCG